MTEDLKKLAADSYNRAFELVIEGSPDELLEGLELAATSLNLWRKLGPERRVSIGLWLYSRALEKSGAQKLAIQAATESLRLAKIDGQDWMIASSLEALTRATRNTPDFAANRKLAISAIDAISEAEDRELIASQFADLV